MIGVVADKSRFAVIREFFELFKTPWEGYESQKHYDVLICDETCNLEGVTAGLIVIFRNRDAHSPSVRSLDSGSSREDCRYLLYRGTQIPIYGVITTFSVNGLGSIREADSLQPAAYRVSGAQTTLGVGYDLFFEIETLLTTGQPICNAALPTLEWHIRVLRELILCNGARLIEIPPVPEGARMIACLTHDVDHPAIRLHHCDRTVLGFLYRALVRSPIRSLQGRMSIRNMLHNWLAVLKLPFVLLGLADDFWRRFDGYLKHEQGMQSTFFVIPFKGHPGQMGSRQAPKRRATAYGARDIETQLRKLVSAGCEVGLHGLDAWHDPIKGRLEFDEIRRATGIRELGVRMHWLFFDSEAPKNLELAGAEYDSTVGYNETVGFRSGTSQVYKPLGATRLLELPLHIMDTALFLAGYLNLKPCDADRRINDILNHVEECGGVVTINWHDRSIAPERHWEQTYIRILDNIRNRSAWIANARDVVRWFRVRRSVRFETIDGVEVPRLEDSAPSGERLPGLLLRVHSGTGIGWTDVPLVTCSRGTSAPNAAENHAFVD
jgi:hypothetical protein